jgi:selenocysteine-specific elongation factor
MTLVTGNAWADSWMLTVKARVLPHSAWPLETGQRVRVLLGTAEALARSAVLEAPAVAPGETGWVQLRLETPLLARAGDRVILRSYSPVTTLGGGEVAEPHPHKRKRLDEGVAEGLEALIRGDARSRLEAATELAGWAGVARADLPVRTGLTPAEVEAAVERLVGEGGLESKQRIFGAGITSAAAGRIAEEVDRNHREDPLSPSVALDKLRTALPDWASAGLADAVIGRMAERGVVELAEGGARRPGFVPTFTADQEEACGRLRSLYAQAGLAPPFLDELPPDLRSRMDLAGLIRHLERDGRLVRLDEGLLVAADVLRAAGESVTNELGGRTGLGPSDFRDVLPVSRRHLMPLLAFFDGAGVTVRKGPVRDVPDGR